MANTFYPYNFANDAAPRHGDCLWCVEFNQLLTVRQQHAARVDMHARPVA